MLIKNRPSPFLSHPFKQNTCAPPCVPQSVLYLPRTRFHFSGWACDIIVKLSQLNGSAAVFEPTVSGRHEHESSRGSEEDVRCCAVFSGRGVNECIICLIITTKSRRKGSISSSQQHQPRSDRFIWGFFLRPGNYCHARGWCNKPKYELFTRGRQSFWCFDLFLGALGPLRMISFCPSCDYCGMLLKCVNNGRFGEVKFAG